MFKTFSAAVYGIDAYLVEVEVDLNPSQSDWHFTTVGLPDAAVKESRDRVRSALRNCGYNFPPQNITVNLAPGDMKKEGSGFDLPRDYDTYIEFWGDIHTKSPEKRRVKERLYQENKLQLVGIEVIDTDNLDEILKYKLKLKNGS